MRLAALWPAAWIAKHCPVPAALSIAAIMCEVLLHSKQSLVSGLPSRRILIKLVAKRVCCHAPFPLAHAPSRSGSQGLESLLRLPTPGAAPRQRGARRVWQSCCSRLPRSVSASYLSAERMISVLELVRRSKITRHCELKRGPQTLTMPCSLWALQNRRRPFE